MTTPPEVLVKNGISFDGRIILRLLNGEIDCSITADEAMVLAKLGEIEAVGNRNGRIRHFRYLPDHIRHIPLPTENPRNDESYQSSSTGFAKTNLGVYRQPITQTIQRGEAHALALGVIIGYCYAHCRLRGTGL